MRLDCIVICAGYASRTFFAVTFGSAVVLIDFEPYILPSGFGAMPILAPKPGSLGVLIFGATEIEVPAE